MSWCQIKKNFDGAFVANALASWDVVRELGGKQFVKMSDSGLKATLEFILSHGVQRLPDRSLRLQLLVFNCALLLSVGLTLGLGLLFIIFEQYDQLLQSTFPFIGLFAIIYLFARQRYFLLARILFVILTLASLAYGVFLYGRQSQLPLYCIDLAVLAFLLFRPKEWPWMTISAVLAFILFVLIEFELFPTQRAPLPRTMDSYVSFFFSMGAFLGVMAPSLLVLWQTHEGFRRTLRLNHIQSRDEKFAAIGRLAAGAAHEINNPLAIVQLTLENLENSFELMKQPTIQTRVKRGYEAIQRIHQILQKLLASTLLPAAQPESWLLSDVAQLIGQRCHRFLKGQGISLSILNDLPPGYRLLCHQQSVIHVVDSLIHNALEAMRGQGRPRVVLTLTCEDLYFLMKFEDSGPGVAEEHLRSIFTPFFTSKDIGTGMGLSLYSARCIAQQHGGDLTCDRGPGGRFYLRLPLLQSDSSSRQA